MKQSDYENACISAKIKPLHNATICYRVRHDGHIHRAHPVAELDTKKLYDYAYCEGSVSTFTWSSMSATKVGGRQVTHKAHHNKIRR